MQTRRCRAFVRVGSDQGRGLLEHNLKVSECLEATKRLVMLDKPVQLPIGTT